MNRFKKVLAILMSLLLMVASIPGVAFSTPNNAVAQAAAGGFQLAYPEFPGVMARMEFVGTRADDYDIYRLVIRVGAPGGFSSYAIAFSYDNNVVIPINVITLNDLAVPGAFMFRWLVNSSQVMEWAPLTYRTVGNRTAFMRSAITTPRTTQQGVTTSDLVAMDAFYFRVLNNDLTNLEADSISFENGQHSNVFVNANSGNRLGMAGFRIDGVHDPESNLFFTLGLNNYWGHYNDVRNNNAHTGSNVGARIPDENFTIRLAEPCDECNLFPCVCCEFCYRYPCECGFEVSGTIVARTNVPIVVELSQNGNVVQSLDLDPGVREFTFEGVTAGTYTVHFIQTGSTRFTVNYVVVDNENVDVDELLADNIDCGCTHSVCRCGRYIALTRGDVNNSGEVDAFDLMDLVGRWRILDMADPDDQRFDITGSGEVDAFALMDMVGSLWGAISITVDL